MCSENKKRLGDELSLEERTRRLGEIYFIEVNISSEKGKIRLKIYGKMEEEELKIMGVESYAEGS